MPTPQENSKPQLPQRYQAAPTQAYQPDVLSAWRFQLLTADAVEHKLSTLQEIYRAELAAEHKVYLLLDCLRDERQAVREAALAGLQCLGLNQRLTLPVRQLMQGDRQGLNMLHEIRDALSDFDVLALLMLLQQLMENGKLTCDRALLLFLRDIADKCPLPPALVIKWLALIIDAPWAQLAGETGLLWQLFSTMARAASDAVYAFLWQEIRTRQDGEKRTFLLKAARAIGIRAGEEEEFFRHITQGELDKYLAQPRGMYDFESDLAARCAQSVPLLCQRLQSDTAHTVALVELVERIVTQADAGEDAMKLCCQTVLTVAHKAGAPAMQRLVWGTLFHGDRLSHVWRKAFAEEIVAIVLSYKSVPEFYEEMTAAMGRLGSTAMTTIVDVLFGQQHRAALRETGSQLMRSLHELARTMPEQTVRETLGDFIPRSMAQLVDIASQESVPIPQQKLAGEWVSLLCHLLSMPSFASKNSDRELLHFVLRSLWRFPATGALIDILAGLFPRLNATAKKQVAEILQGMLQRNWDVADRDIQQLEKDSSVQMHLYWLPAILQCTLSVCLSLPRRNKTRADLFKALLQKWQTVMQWKEVWSPGNVMLFFQSLTTAIAHASLDKSEREALAASLLPACEQFAPAAVLSALLPAWGCNADVTTLCLSLARKLIDAVSEEEVTAGSYQALARLLLQPQLPPDLASATLYALVGGCQRQHQDAIDSVAELLHNTSLAPAHAQFLRDKARR